MRSFVLMKSDHSNVTDKCDYVYYRIKRVHRWGDTATAMTEALSREKPRERPGSYWNEALKWLQDRWLHLYCVGIGDAPQPRAVTLSGGQVVHCAPLVLTRQNR